MDTFTLKINQYNNTAALYLNGERMDYYDEDIDLESDSFLMWAGCFWKVMENATEGDYRLVVYGSEYEQMFLRDISSNYPRCKEFIEKNYKFDYSMNDRIDDASHMYTVDLGQSLEWDSLKQWVYMDPIEGTDNLPYIYERYIRLVNSKDAEIIFAESMEAAEKYVKSSHSVLVIVESDRAGVEYSYYGKYIWRVSPERAIDVFTDTINYLWEREVFSRLVTDLEEMPVRYSYEDQERIRRFRMVELPFM